MSKERRDALNDLYAFCRLVDDISDETSIPAKERREALAAVRGWLDQPNSASNHSYWNRWAEEIRAFSIPVKSLKGIVDGVAIDCFDTPVTFQTWEDLNYYVQGVACCVGECVLAILGEHGARAEEHALWMGRTLQYLNILRDRDEDAARGRNYVPEEFLKTLPTEAAVRLELFRRAEDFYQRAEIFSWACLPGYLMTEIYFTGAKKYWLLGEARRLTKSQKIWSTLRGFLKFLIIRINLRRI